MRNCRHAGESETGSQFIFFTSGSTGKPKGVNLSCREVGTNALLLGKRKGIKGGLDVGVVAQPFSHVGGMVVNLLAQMLNGVTCVLHSRSFDPRKALEVVQDESCTVLDGVPTQFEIYLKLPIRQTLDLQTLCKGAVGAASIAPETLRRMVAHDGLNFSMLIVSYGMTETSPISFAGSVEDTLPVMHASVGRIQVRARCAVLHLENLKSGLPCTLRWM